MDLSQALEVATRSDPGMVRTNNEDSVLADPVHGVVILADGMGGYNAGEVASGMATALLGTELSRAIEVADGVASLDMADLRDLLNDEITRANGAIHQASVSHPQYSGMGTTLVTGVFHDNRMSVAHIGDSRMYRLRGEEFSQVTRDHSFLQEQIDAGIISREDARHAQNKNLVTRALGVDARVEVEIHDYEVEPGDIYLLCSDGLNDMVDDDEISMTLQALGANLELCAMQLVQMANDNGGRDNVSVILVKIRKPFPSPRGWFSRILGRAGIK
ncbi:MAG TPA: Stp1/IreP family PP2C-type Ser/Thr phosphatase [Rhodocyclaceae bacterium]